MALNPTDFNLKEFQLLLNLIVPAKYHKYYKSKKDICKRLNHNIQWLDHICNNDITSDFALALLNQHGININDPIDSNGNTPLLLAVAHDNIELINILLAEGADPLISNNDGFTPMMYAYRKDKIEIIKLIKMACKLKYGLNKSLFGIQNIESGQYERCVKNK